MKIYRIFLFDIYQDDWHQCQKYAENCVHRVNVIIKDNKSILWIKMHNMQVKMVVKNMSNLTIKIIRGICNTETPTSKLKK